MIDTPSIASGNACRPEYTRIDAPVENPAGATRQAPSVAKEEKNVINDDMGTEVNPKSQALNSLISAHTCSNASAKEMQSSFTDDVIDTITSKTDESRDLNVGQTGSATGATEADSVILPPEISGEKPTAN